MKIHYNKEFNCFETTECHKTDNIELEGVKLIPITELEKIKAEIENIPNDETTKPIGTYDYCLGAENERKIVLQIFDNHISELKGENKCH